MKLVTLLVALAIAPPTSAQIVYVDDTATGANDGSSWQDAFTSLQSALLASTPTTEIWVARGTYEPTSNLDRGQSFDVECAVYGGFDGTETSLAERAGLFDETILSGDLLGNDGPDFAGNDENSLHVVYMPSSLLEPAILDGFTIRGGNADSGPSVVGGGLFVGYWAYDVVVRNCTFTANHAVRGGGIGSPSKSILAIERCTFVGNRARYVGGGVDGGMNTEIRGCIFVGNSAGSLGGGLNFADLAVDCVFSGNEAGDEGGGAHTTDKVWNCTFSGNTARLGGGMAGGYPWGPRDLVNCVLWGNHDATGSARSAQIAGYHVVDDSVVQGWDGSIPGAGTIDADPLLRSPLGADGIAGTLDDDLRLELGSPCIDTGEAHLYPGLGFDALGRARFADALGCDAGGVLDRGAIERGQIDGTTTFCESTPSSLGVAAEIGAVCTVHLSDGAFPIVARPVPVSSASAFLLIGAPGSPQTFGDGVLCLSGSPRRLAATSQSGQTVTFLLDPSVPPGSDVLAPGATVGLQALFRDPGAGGAGFNLSSAMRLLALP